MPTLLRAKALILEGFAERHEDAIINFSFVFVSSDLHHDPAFVQHAFDKLLTPWFNAHVAPDVRVTGTTTIVVS